MFKRRLKKVYSILEKRNLDAIIIFSGETTIPDIYYYTGFYDNWANALLVSNNSAVLYTSVPDYQKKNLKIKTERLRRDFSHFRGLKKVGVGPETPFSIVRKLRKIGIYAVSLDEDLEKIRSIKDRVEIKKIKKACAATKNIYEDVCESLEKNNLKTEIEVEKFIKKRIIDSGFEEAFDPVVASGRHSADIHAIAGRKKIAKNLLLDFGCVYENYKSDLSRTIAKSRKIQRISDIVKTVHDDVIDMLEAGINARVLLDHARAVFKKHGLENKCFLNYHSIGHGIGLSVHEHPRLAEDVFLEKNMVFTIEPAVYDPKLGGVRIENVIWLKKKGKILTK